MNEESAKQFAWDLGRLSVFAYPVQSDDGTWHVELVA